MIAAPASRRPGRRLAAAAALTFALVAGMVSVGATPASASISVLCKGYDSCTSKGKSNYGYKAAADNLYWRMAGGHNCTNYVAYRLVKAGMTNVRPWMGDGNAYAWGTLNPEITDGVPVKGAVAWWGANRAPMSSSGHVAYVEKVISSSEIIISEDNWKGEFFYKRVTKSGGGWPSGFVHLKDSRTPAAPRYDAELVSQSVWTHKSKTAAVSPATLNPGAKVWVELTYRNTGRLSWSGVQLGTTTPLNRASALSAKWASATRAAVQKEKTVKPGAIATFGFVVTIPADAATGTTWTENFAPVAGRGTWMTGGSASTVFGADDREPFTATPIPTISGTTRAGAVLTATPGTWAPSGAGLKYQWKRDGVAISRATGSGYTLGEYDAGRRITVSVTATRTGYLPSTQTSAVTAPISSATGDTLRPGVVLTTDKQLVSKNGQYQFVQLASGEARITDRLSGIPLWSTATTGSSYRSSLTSSGNLVVRNTAGTVKWTSATASGSAKLKPVKLVMRNDGRLGLYNAAGKLVWTSAKSGR